MKQEEIHSLLAEFQSLGLAGPLSSFGPDVANVIEVTNSRCRKGTRMFYDPETGVKYSSSAAGYVRRYVPIKWFGLDIISKTVLNPTRREEYIWGERTYTRRKAILLSEETDRLEIVARGVRNYRKTMKK